MNRELLSKALCEIDERYIAEAYRPVPEAASGSSERIVPMKKKRIITFALAAALILALGAMAYAADLFGLKALLITNGSLSSPENVNGGRLSITQPQAVPEEMDSAIREKIDHSAKAWAEWRAWCEENAPREPESCRAPENARGTGAAAHRRLQERQLQEDRHNQQAVCLPDRSVQNELFPGHCLQEG